MSSFLFRIIIVLVALGLPLGIAMSQKGGALPTFTKQGIAEWSPVQGPSLINNLTTELLVTHTLPDRRDIPEWATQEDIAHIDKILLSFQKSDLTKAFGETLVLMASLDERGIDKGILLGILLPEISVEVFKTVGSAAMLGMFGFILVVLIFSPWIVNSLGQALGLLAAFLVGIYVMFELFWMGIEGIGYITFNFAMIEYLGWAIFILLIANILIGISGRRSSIDYSDMPIMSMPQARPMRRSGGAARPVGQNQSAEGQQTAPRQWGNSNLNNLSDS